MFGENESPEYRGMIPRSVEYLFQTLTTKGDDMGYTISCSFLEIYNDAVRDLGKAYLVATGMAGDGASVLTEKTSDLFNSIAKKRTDAYYAPAFKRQLSGSSFHNSEAFEQVMNQPGIRGVQEEYNTMHYDIREDGEGNVFVKDLSNIPVQSVNEVLAVIKMGLKVRATHETKMNSTSSRSHTVFTLTVVQHDKASGASICGMLNLVDLAGSERLKKSESQGARLKEALHINTSLTALGKVVMSLEQAADKAHVPYRDSKLTRILQNSLGGNSYTTLMAAVHPNPGHYDECLSTLQFANRCRNVTNNPRVNYVGSSDAEDKDRKIRRLMEEIVQLRAKLAQFERSGAGGGGAFTGFALAEKIQKVLMKVGIKAEIGADGALNMGGKKITLEELNELALEGVDDPHVIAAAMETTKAPNKSVEKLQIIIQELETANMDMKLKYKRKKEQAEAMASELEDLTNEFNRAKQSWTHTEFELKRAITETTTAAKGMERLMNKTQGETVAQLMARNQEIIDDQYVVLNSLPKALETLTRTARTQKEKTRVEIIEPMKKTYDKIMAEVQESRRAELENQKQQYMYWLNKKDDILKRMTEGFNKYREKKSSQLRKCEQEIVKLFMYAEKLEGIIKQAEAGKFYVQTTQVAGGQFQSGSNLLDGGHTAGLLIPKSTFPIRPGTERGGVKSGDLELSQKILKKHMEHVKKDEKVKGDMMEALLVQYGALGESSDNEMIDPNLHDQIKGLISSPSIGRDIIATASSNTARAGTAKSDKKHSLFASSPAAPGTAKSDTGAPRPRPPAVADSSDLSYRAAQGNPARTVQALGGATNPRRAQSVSAGTDRRIAGNNASQEPSFDDTAMFTDDGGMTYNFVGNEIMDVNGRVRKGPNSKNDEAMIFSPTSTAPGTRGQFRHAPDSSVDEVMQLRAELAAMREQLANSEQVSGAVHWQ
jgi:hypothetical protein